jgi:hypothetical protein
MIKIQITRSLLAIATMVTLLAVPVRLRATELHPLVVTGIALSVVAKTHLIVTDPSEIDHEIRSLSEGLVLKRGYGHCGNHRQ